MKAPALLSAYRLASTALGVAAPLYLYWQGKLGRDDFARRNERLGNPCLSRPAGPLGWIDIESAAEARLLFPLAQKLAGLGFTVLITLRSLVHGMPGVARLPHCLVQLSPLDTPQCIGRFLTYWRPAIALVCGFRVLPNLMAAAKARAIAAGFINARAPASPAFLSRPLSFLSAELARQADFCVAQTEEGAQFFAGVGMRSIQVAGDLKYDLLPAPIDEFALARLLARIGTRPVWAAFELEPGEEEAVLKAHRALTQKFPGALLLVIPQSPKRAFDLAAMAARLGLTSGLTGDRDNAPLPQVYIGRSAAETGLFCRAAGAVFLGKSLSGAGGTNPCAEARLGCAILHGPDVWEYDGLYQELDRLGGGAAVPGSEALAQQIAVLFENEAKLRAMGRAAAAAAASFAGASARTIEAIAPYLAQALVAG